MGQRQQRMDGDILAAQIVPIRPTIAGPFIDDEYEEPKVGWFGRRLEDAGIKEMAPTSTRPPGYNWTVIGGICTVISTVLILTGLLCAATWYMSALNSQMQSLKDKNQELEQKVRDAQAEAAEAKKFSIYATAGADEKNGHKPNQEKK